MSANLRSRDRGTDPGDDYVDVLFGVKPGRLVETHDERPNLEMTVTEIDRLLAVRELDDPGLDLDR